MLQRSPGSHGLRLATLTLVAAGGLFAAVGASQSTEPVADVMERGRRDAQRFYAGRLAELRADFDDTMQKGLSLEALRGFHAQIGEQLGEESSLIDEKLVEQGGYRSYVRLVKFAKGDRPFQVVFAYDADDRIAGFVIQPQQQAAPTEFLDYEPEVRLRLPFVDAWDVFWGGRSVEQNYHAAYPDQRFAYDFLIVRDGATHTEDGSGNEQYHCFDLPIVAPAAGTVVAARNDVEDNVPGVLNPAQALGNHVILDHGNDEYSFLAHFKKGTVTVEVGDAVVAGQPLGRSGNSGNTSEPHLHYHLQNTPRFNDGQGLPAPFHDYLADGRRVDRGEPVQGQRVSPAGD